MVSAIRAQVDAARSVLDAANSKIQMSDADFQAARKRLDEARREIDKAEEESREAGELLRRIETRILDAQGPLSELGQVRAKVDKLRAELDRELHRLVKLPDHATTPTADDFSREMSRLSDADREKVRGDQQYQEASKKLNTAKQEYSQIRTKLLESDADWRAASRAIEEARDKENDARKLAASAGVTSRNSGRELGTQKELAAEAQAVIARGEAALRRLGVKDAGAKGKNKR